MNAPPFPLNPAVGQRFGNWAWNGSRWVSTRATGIQVVTQQWTVAGSYPYQPSPGLVSLVVECIGAGGGGGGALGEITTGAGWVQAGGGGASGGYSRKTLPAALVLGGVIVQVGPGGLAGTATTATATAGGTGGDTSFGAFCLAKGGNGGYPSIGLGGTGTAVVGGGGSRGEVAPGQPGIGDICGYGNGGGSGMNNYYDPAEAASGQSICFGGQGGGSFLQSAEKGVYQSATGAVGGFGAYGAGGGGGASSHAAGPAAGGPGGDGVCIVTEYCWGDASDDDCSAFPGQTLNVDARVALEREPWGHRPPGKPGWRPTGFSGDPNAYEEGE